MPADLAIEDPDLLVTNRRGEVLPFSRGIMATSLLSTGVPTEEAYRLASLVQRALHADRRTRHDSDELVRAACAVLRDQPGGERVANRWLAWRAARRSGRPIVIVLSGAPGVGKSTLATRLAVRLEITRIVTTDAIREVLRTVVPPAVLPELHTSTFELIDLDQPDPFADFDRQCDAVANALAAVADRLVTEARSMIAEGVHLPPGVLAASLADHPRRPVVVERLVTAPQDAHLANLGRRRSTEPLREGHRHLRSFEHIVAIQRHLVARAAEEGVATMDIGEATALTQDLVGEIVERLERVAS
jgi:2-phosphoglycerate kinase